MVRKMQFRSSFNVVINIEQSLKTTLAFATLASIIIIIIIIVKLLEHSKNIIQGHKVKITISFKVTNAIGAAK